MQIQYIPVAVTPCLGVSAASLPFENHRSSVAVFYGICIRRGSSSLINCWVATTGGVYEGSSLNLLAVACPAGT